MAWLGKVSLGGFPDLAGAVTKLSESVKNIEKNFDSALGFEEKTEVAEGGSPSGQWPSAEKTLFNPVMAFIGHKSGDSAESEHKTRSSRNSSPVKGHNESHPDTISEESVNFGAKQHKEDEPVDVAFKQDNISGILEEPAEGHNSSYHIKSEQGNEVANLPIEEKEPINRFQETSGSLQREGQDSIGVAPVEIPKDVEDSHVDNDAGEPLSTSEELHNEQPQMLHTAGLGSSQERPEVEQFADVSPSQVEVLDNQVGEADEDIQQRKDEGDVSSATSASRITNDVPLEVETNVSADATGSGKEISMVSEHRSIEHEVLAAPSALSSDSNETLKDSQIVVTDDSGSANFSLEMEKLTTEMKMMEAALQGAARQAQAKADEIAKLLIENEQLKSTLEDMTRRSSDAELESLREEYHHKVSNLEKKVYILTKERDALRREQSRKSDAAVLLKEKDEIISQVMAEGEELSKKQATQEATIRKLRAQIREFEEEKQRLNSKIQVEESKVESMKRDKAATEKLLQETVEKSQAELASQKEFYINALNVAKEAQALAEARANTEAKIELEHRLREAGEREAALVQTLDELRQTLSRTEQQAVFREEMLRRDIDDLQKRYQASELRCEELITQVPESTRPLLRQIEAIQETSTRRAEVWSGVERSLNARLQEAEAKAAAAEEKERSMNERLSQTLSRMAVLEAQVSCLRTEQTQLTRSLEKERQRASENRQEYLALQESAATLEGRAKQLEDELRELRSKHKQQLQEEAARREFLEEELEREKTGRQDMERGAQMVRPIDLDQETTSKYASNQYLANGTSISFNRLSSAGSLNSMEESYFLQASLDSSDNVISDRRMAMDFTASPYFGKSMTPGAIEHLEATLRQKDGELSSYISRLNSLESIRDSLAEELVKMTAQCEKLQVEVSQVSPLRAELEALRRRHTSALELMGERDEELEELRADIFDLKEMYREQVDLLVNKIQVLSASAR